MAGKPFALVGVNSDADREAIKKVMADEKISWRSWWDDGRIDGPIHTTWQIAERPSMHLLDGQGVIRYKNIAVEEVDAAIDGLLSERKPE